MSTLKIYFENKPFYLTNLLSDELKKLTSLNNTILSTAIHTDAISTLIEKINSNQVDQIIVLNDDWDVLKSNFFQLFELQKAGGGLVHNEQNEILMIFRRGLWDLPKGKLEEGETIQECAIREVQEETGLKNILLGEKSGITYHTYNEHGKAILKESHWYSMSTEENALKPQIEEDITKIKWVSKNEITKYLSQSFAAIRDVIQMSDWYHQ